jgi:hypothetical protein
MVKQRFGVEVRLGQVRLLGYDVSCDDNVKMEVS